MEKKADNTAELGKIGRRELLRRWGPAALAGVVLGGAGKVLVGRPSRHERESTVGVPPPPDWRTDATAAPRIAVASGGTAEDKLARSLGPLGGIETFIRPGERVAIKPNCAWDRTAEQAANTDPDLIGALTRLCIAAGAASVVVLDSSCHDPARTFARSGIAAAAREAGATVAHQNSVGTVPLDLGGTVLGVWEVLEPLATADRVINVPVVKHHSLARATLGMKNWFGALVGRRSTLHQRLPQVCAELGAAFRPTLTVVDATRVLTRGGPTGGSLALVRAANRIAVATDPVAAEAWGAEELGLAPSELPHLAIAVRLGLGTEDWSSVLVQG